MLQIMLQIAGYAVPDYHEGYGWWRWQHKEHTYHGCV